MTSTSKSENDAFEALYGKFGVDIPSFDLRLYKPDMHQTSKPSILGNTYFPENSCNVLICLLVIVALLLIFVKGKQVLSKLQPSRSKGVIPLLWATFTMCHIFNIYMAGKVFIASCYYIHTKKDNGSAVRDCACVIFQATTFVILGTIFAAYTHSKYHVLPIPKLLLNCTNFCGRYEQPRRVVGTLSISAVYCSVMILVGCIPYQLLLVSSNPHLYGFSILTSWSVMLGCIVVLAIPFTIDQVFITEKEYGITPKQALQQILLLIFTSLLLFGMGSMTFSITLILHLSKYGEKTQSVSTSVYFIVRHLVIPIVLWMGRRAMQKLNARNNSLWMRS